MSSNVKIIAGLLGCVALAIVWFGRGSDPGASPETLEPATSSESVYKKPKRRMVLDQPVVRGDLEADSMRPGVRGNLGEDESAGPGMLKGSLEAPPKKVKERRAARKQMSDSPVEEEEDGFEHWRDVALNDPDPDERAEALSQLDFEEPEAMEVLVMALRDSSSEVRQSALDELWVNTDEPPLDLLAPVLNDPDAEIRAEAVRMIADSEDPLAFELLESVLGDQDEDVRSEAADALDLDENDFVDAGLE